MLQNRTDSEPWACYLRGAWGYSPHSGSCCGCGDWQKLLSLNVPKAHEGDSGHWANGSHDFINLDVWNTCFNHLWNLWSLDHLWIPVLEFESIGTRLLLLFWGCQGSDPLWQQHALPFLEILKHRGCRVLDQTYSDLTRPKAPKRKLRKGNHLISEKSRLVKYW